MNARERVLRAVNHEEPDRVPIDQGSMRSSGIMAIAYNRVKVYLGVKKGETCLYDLVQQLAVPEEWYLERFHVDVADVGRAFVDAISWSPWTLPDGSPAKVPFWFSPEYDNGTMYVRDKEGTVIGKMPAGSLYIDQACWPVKEAGGLDHFEPLDPKMAKVIWQALPTPPFDRELTNDYLEEVGRRAKQLYEETDYAITLPIGCNLFEWAQYLCGMEDFFVSILTERKKMEALLDRLMEIHLNFLAKILPHVGEYVQFVVVGDDLGMNTGPQISPKLYREVFLPRHKQIYQFAKEHSNGHIFMHSCGAIFELIPLLIEAGVEVLNPVQTNARGMDPKELKREFGKEITFWGGGADTRHILPYGTPEEVKEHVKRQLDIFAPGGGYVFTPIHNILADVPPRNVIAMFEAAYEFGQY